MNPLNLATTSSPSPVANDLLALKERPPTQNETTTQPQQENVNLVGKAFSAVVAGSSTRAHRQCQGERQ
ncbi:hypothetical protein Bca52824_088656 [Brassica carinata]|uniref:Uncharacterized protein n=1 Tax=Brassica carinata TaxID=52824 RepID=A0A8X7PDR8_BRACI|nr:hypothetical protein Bca52824_088656 [Brassica carinata]